jgi:hypothetical protein
LTGAQQLFIKHFVAEVNLYHHSVVPPPVRTSSASIIPLVPGHSEKVKTVPAGIQSLPRDIS